MPQPTFISEPVRPEPGSFDTGRMATGEPGLPQRFTWRGQACEVAAVLRTWKEAGPCRSGSAERYVRKHCYEVRLITGAVATLYFERQARSAQQKRLRWWLFSLQDPEEASAHETRSPH